MIVLAAAIPLSLVVLACLWVIRDQAERHAHELAAVRMEARDERALLLERIQRPERVMPLPGQPEFVQPDPPEDEEHLIGTVTIDDLTP